MSNAGIEKERRHPSGKISPTQRLVNGTQDWSGEERSDILEKEAERKGSESVYGGPISQKPWFKS